MEIRRLTADDWRAYREIRLAALADAPWAFSSTLAGERDRPEEMWRRRAGGERTAERSAVSFVAVEGERWVGLAGGILEARSTDADLVSMWVDQAARGKGIGRTLIDAVRSWAVEQGASTLTLWVTEGNAPAERLYERYGFEPTGERQPLPSDPSRTERQMRMPL